MFEKYDCWLATLEEWVRASFILDSNMHIQHLSLYARSDIIMVLLVTNLQKLTNHKSTITLLMKQHSKYYYD